LRHEALAPPACSRIKHGGVARAHKCLSLEFYLRTSAFQWLYFWQQRLHSRSDQVGLQSLMLHPLNKQPSHNSTTSTSASWFRCPKNTTSKSSLQPGTQATSGTNGSLTLSWTVFSLTWATIQDSRLWHTTAIWWLKKKDKPLFWHVYSKFYLCHYRVLGLSPANNTATHQVSLKLSEAKTKTNSTPPLDLAVEFILGSEEFCKQIFDPNSRPYINMLTTRSILGLSPKQDYVIFNNQWNRAAFHEGLKNTDLLHCIDEEYRKNNSYLPNW